MRTGRSICVVCLFFLVVSKICSHFVRCVRDSHEHIYVPRVACLFGCLFGWLLFVDTVLNVFPFFYVCMY